MQFFANEIVKTVKPVYAFGRTPESSRPIAVAGEFLIIKGVDKDKLIVNRKGIEGTPYQFYVKPDEVSRVIDIIEIEQKTLNLYTDDNELDEYKKDCLNKINEEKTIEVLKPEFLFTKNIKISKNSDGLNIYVIQTCPSLPKCWVVGNEYKFNSRIIKTISLTKIDIENLIK